MDIDRLKKKERRHSIRRIVASGLEKNKIWPSAKEAVSKTIEGNLAKVKETPLSPFGSSVRSVCALSRCEK